jgi:GT2 family glycosyltransferase
MPKQAPFVSFIVVNWNGLEDTKICLESISKIDYADYEIIVVDNGSKDGSKAYLEKLDDIIYVDLPDNTGFTGGHIAGSEAAKGKYLAILNNDLVIDKEWVKKALETFERHKKAAVVGGKAFKWNKENPIYDKTNEFYSYQEVDPVKGYTKTLETGEEECSVDSISGAALLIDRAAINEVGYFDDDFFAYYEETDLIARLKRAGFEAYYNPSVAVWHKVAASSTGGEAGEFYLRQMHRNRYYFAYKNFDDLNVKRFINSYRHEVVVARLKKAFRRGVNQEVLSRIAAKEEIKSHQRALDKKRTEVMKLGATYSQKLESYKPVDVTIIIPCYNYGDHVAEAIQSALKQTVQPKQIIVINDGSTDTSLDEINKFKGNPIVTIVDKKNEGVIAAKNLGIKMSKTYWTMFLDADDLIDEDTLRTMLKSVDLDGRVDVIYSDMKLFGNVRDYFRARPFQAHTFLAQNYINNTTLINTTSLKRTGGYKQEMAGGLEDWELYVTLFEQGARFRYIPQPLVHYRQHSGAITSRNTQLQDVEIGRKHFELIRSLHPGCYRKYNSKLRYGVRIINSLYLLFRHPGVIVVIIRSIPGAIVQGLRHTLHSARVYLQTK